MELGHSPCFSICFPLSKKMHRSETKCYNLSLVIFDIFFFVSINPINLNKSKTKYKTSFVCVVKAHLHPFSLFE